MVPISTRNCSLFCRTMIQQCFRQRRWRRSTFLKIQTHDSDFGALTIHQGEPVIGEVNLRPGHINPRSTIDTLTTVLGADPDLAVPFLLVARRRGDSVTLRIRHLVD